MDEISCASLQSIGKAVRMRTHRRVSGVLSSVHRVEILIIVFGVVLPTLYMAYLLWNAIFL
jgi:hypothetical protein